ncbi:MAG: trigger factor [Deltaproteobacteria bacterium]|nr:trigger factor [Deltaproteobacteria bacterium]
MGDMVAKVEIEEISSVKKKLSFEVLWDDVKKELDSVYKTVGKSARVKGFRPGKVPRNILEVHYKEQAEEEVISNLISKHYSEVVEKNNIQAVAQPVIDQKGITTGADFLFDATVEIAPVVDPKDYVGLDLEREELDITEADIEERLDQIRQMHAVLKDVEGDRGLVNNDFAVIDFDGKLDGEARKELASKDHTLEIGSGSFVPGFEEQMLGMKRGESKDITVTFPEDYGATDIAGKEVLFSVTLKSIREKILPEVDEEFVKNFDKYESLEDLKKDIKKSLGEDGEAKIQADLRNTMIDKLLENNEFEVPSAWVEKQIYSMMLDARQRMVQNGMPEDKASEVSYNLHDGFNDTAARLVKASFIFNEIAKKESIEVTEKDVEDRLTILAQKYAQDYEAVKKAYETNNMEERLKDELLEQKAIAFIEEKANIILAKKDKKKKKGKGEK